MTSTEQHWHRHGGWHVSVGSCVPPVKPVNKASTPATARSDQNEDHQIICTTARVMWSNLGLQEQLYSWKMDRHVWWLTATEKTSGRIPKSRVIKWIMFLKWFAAIGFLSSYFCMCNPWISHKEPPATQQLLLLNAHIHKQYGELFTHMYFLPPTISAFQFVWSPVGASFPTVTHIYFEFSCIASVPHHPEIFRWGQMPKYL